MEESSSHRGLKLSKKDCFKPAVAVTGIAVSRQTHLHGAVADERDEAQPMSQKLVVEHRRVSLNFHQVDSKRGHFSYHYAPERISHARVRITQLEFHHVILHVADTHRRKPLVRNIVHLRSQFFLFLFFLLLLLVVLLSSNHRS